MLVYISTSAKDWVTEHESGDPGAAAVATWQQISAGAPLTAGLAQAGGGVGESCRVVFNPGHVIAVHALATQDG